MKCVMWCGVTPIFGCLIFVFNVTEGICGNTKDCGEPLAIGRYHVTIESAILLQNSHFCPMCFGSSVSVQCPMSILHCHLGHHNHFESYQMMSNGTFIYNVCMIRAICSTPMYHTRYTHRMDEFYYYILVLIY